MTEPEWSRPLREALLEAASLLRGDIQDGKTRYSASDINRHLQRAVAAGWVPPDDAHADFWLTASKLSHVSGSWVHLPIKAFMEREAARVSR
jgi:hypothetical protein